MEAGLPQPKDASGHEYAVVKKLFYEKDVCHVIGPQHSEEAPTQLQWQTPQQAAWPIPVHKALVTESERQGMATLGFV